MEALRTHAYGDAGASATPAAGAAVEKQSFLSGLGFGRSNAKQPATGAAGASSAAGGGKHHHSHHGRQLYGADHNPDLRQKLASLALLFPQPSPSSGADGIRSSSGMTSPSQSGGPIDASAMFTGTSLTSVSSATNPYAPLRTATSVTAATRNATGSGADVAVGLQLPSPTNGASSPLPLPSAIRPVSMEVSLAAAAALQSHSASLSAQTVASHGSTVSGLLTSSGDAGGAGATPAQPRMQAPWSLSNGRFRRQKSGLPTSVTAAGAADSGGTSTSASAIGSGGGSGLSALFSPSGSGSGAVASGGATGTPSAGGGGGGHKYTGSIDLAALCAQLSPPRQQDPDVTTAENTAATSGTSARPLSMSTSLLSGNFEAAALLRSLSLGWRWDDGAASSSAGGGGKSGYVSSGSSGTDDTDSGGAVKPPAAAAASAASKAAPNAAAGGGGGFLASMGVSTRRLSNASQQLPTPLQIAASASATSEPAGSPPLPRPQSLLATRPTPLIPVETEAEDGLPCGPLPVLDSVTGQAWVAPPSVAPDGMTSAAAGGTSNRNSSFFGHLSPTALAAAAAGGPARKASSTGGDAGTGKSGGAAAGVDNDAGSDGDASAVGSSGSSGSAGAGAHAPVPTSASASSSASSSSAFLTPTINSSSGGEKVPSSSGIDQQSPQPSFNAHEVRLAFLRFFVCVWRDYGKYVSYSQVGTQPPHAAAEHITRAIVRARRQVVLAAHVAPSASPSSGNGSDAVATGSSAAAGSAGKTGPSSNPTNSAISAEGALSRLGVALPPLPLPALTVSFDRDGFIKAHPDAAPSSQKQTCADY